MVREMSGEDRDEASARARTEALSDFFGRGEAFARQLIAENERLRRELQDGGGPVALEAGVVEDLLLRVRALEESLAAAQVAPAAPAEAVSEAAREAPEAEPVEPALAEPALDEAAVAASESAAAPAGAAPASADVEAAPAGADVEAARAAAAAAEAALRAQVDRLEAENYHLATVYIGLQQLHCTRTFGEVIQTLSELLLNFLGIGTFTIFGIDEERSVAFPLVREGGHIEEIEERSLVDDPPIAAAASFGRPWQGGDPTPSEYGVLFFLPLQSGSRLVGIVALESCLAQKESLSDDDFNVLAMLSEHVGIAFENAWLRAQAPQNPLRRDVVEQLVGA